MKNRLQKWGNSLAVRIPKPLAAELGWSESTPVGLSLDDDALVIKTDRERAWDLETLLQGVMEENIPPIVEDAGGAKTPDKGKDEDDR